MALFVVMVFKIIAIMETIPSNDTVRCLVEVSTATGRLQIRTFLFYFETESQMRMQQNANLVTHDVRN
jgi:hypothetical protein